MHTRNRLEKSQCIKWRLNYDSSLTVYWRRAWLVSMASRSIKSCVFVQCVRGHCGGAVLLKDEATHKLLFYNCNVTVADCDKTWNNINKIGCDWRHVGVNSSSAHHHHHHVILIKAWQNASHYNNNKKIQIVVKMKEKMYLAHRHVYLSRV